MPGWDDDSPELEANLAEAQRLATEHALARRRLTRANIKAWHRATMKGLEIKEAAELGVLPQDLVGEFRGPPRLTGIGAEIGCTSRNAFERCRRANAAFHRGCTDLADGARQALPRR